MITTDYQVPGTGIAGNMAFYFLIPAMMPARFPIELPAAAALGPRRARVTWACLLLAVLAFCCGSQKRRVAISSMIKPTAFAYGCEDVFPPRPFDTAK